MVTVGVRSSIVSISVVHQKYSVSRFSVGRAVIVRMGKSPSAHSWTNARGDAIHVVLLDLCAATLASLASVGASVAAYVGASGGCARTLI